MQVNQRLIQQNNTNPKNIENQEPIKQSFKSEKRHQSTFIMMTGFLTIVSMGHFYCSLLIIALAIFFFYEVNSLFRVKKINFRIRISQILSWLIFITSIAFSFIQSLKIQIYNSKIQFLISLQKYNQIIMLVLILALCMFTVMNLKKELLKDQFQIFFRCGLLSFFSFVACKFNYSIYQGQIWFFTAVTMVIINDMFAFVFGKLMGRHKLWELSPKKTVEGFIGGIIGTVCFSVLIAKLCSYNFMRPVLCPQPSLTLIPFSYPNCQLPEMYIQKKMEVYFISNIFGQIVVSEFTIHLTIISLFASLVAPFGGFMASAFKRNMKIKDFSNLIPGHGGVTDRIDCILVMSIFLFYYCKEIIVDEGQLGLISYLTSSKIIQQIIQTIIFD